MMRLALLMLSLVPGSAFAQMNHERLLSGTTLGLPWGLYSGAKSRPQKDESRLQLSARSGARVLGAKYDAGTQSALLSYRDNLNARHALEVAVDQLQRQGFELTFRSWLGKAGRKRSCDAMNVSWRSASSRSLSK
ncbi:hypothetical protein ACFSC4_21265 [Deinococcus malanensis]|uniref:hypothetical protein n=1 Tax=Deinococcus malanensis TaxID=1706855 RepID=UPI00363B6FC1